MINVDTRLLENLDANELYLLMHLVKRIGKNDVCWPSNATLVKDTGWHIEKIQKIKKSLHNKKLINVERSRTIGKSNVYRITNALIRVYVNGKSVNGKPDNGNNGIDHTGKAVTDDGGKSINKVLINEALPTEGLTTFKEDERGQTLMVYYLIRALYPHLDDYKWCYPDNPRFHGLDSSTKGLLKKIHNAAADIEKAFENVNKETYLSISDLERPFKSYEPSNQLHAYVDYCRLTSRPRTTNPDNISQKLIETDWCHTLKSWADPRYYHNYDPLEDDDLLSHWLLECYYYSLPASMDRANPKRVVF